MEWTTSADDLTVSGGPCDSNDPLCECGKPKNSPRRLTVWSCGRRIGEASNPGPYYDPRVKIQTTYESGYIGVFKVRYHIDGSTAGRCTKIINRIRPVSGLSRIQIAHNTKYQSRKRKWATNNARVESENGTCTGKHANQSDPTKRDHMDNNEPGEVGTRYHAMDEHLQRCHMCNWTGTPCSWQKCPECGSRHCLSYDGPDNPLDTV